MKWFWKVPSPRFVYVTMSIGLYACLISAFVYVYYTIVYDSMDAFIVAQIYLATTAAIALMTLAFWSIINAVRWEGADLEERLENLNSLLKRSLEIPFGERSNQEIRYWREGYEVGKQETLEAAAFVFGLALGIAIGYFLGGLL